MKSHSLLTLWSESPEDAPPKPPPRRWPQKFRDAIRGVKLGIRGHSSFCVHFFFAALVTAGAIVLQCSLEQWCILIGCIGLVLTAELFNSALETFVRVLDDTRRPRFYPVLDIAAGAVLLASVTASVIGALVFLKQVGLI